jgi:5-methyltetrahydrofolate--homocysteine methyltransferase
MAINQELYDGVMKGKRDVVMEVIDAALASGSTAIELLDGSMIPAMREMGDRFSKNEVYVPEMLIAARAMQAGLVKIEPILVSENHESLGTVCVGTVKGDLHDIGKNLVAIMLKGAGYDVIDLGVNCDVSKFEQGVKDGANIVLCSALLTTTMGYMQDVVDSFKDNDSVKIIVGGAPVTQEYSDQIGADGYGTDANSAVQVVDALLKAS